MIEIESKLRRWGNSLGIVVPIRKLRKGSLGEGDEVKALIIKKNKVNLRKLFGAHKFSRPIEELLKESDKELYNE